MENSKIDEPVTEPTDEEIATWAVHALERMYADASRLTERLEGHPLCCDRCRTFRDPATDELVWIPDRPGRKSPCASAHRMLKEISELSSAIDSLESVFEMADEAEDADQAAATSEEAPST